MNSYNLNFRKKCLRYSDYFAAYALFDSHERKVASLAELLRIRQKLCLI